MKNPQTFFSAMQKQLNALERLRNTPNQFTKEDYKKVARLHAAAAQVPEQCTDELKSEINQSKKALLDLASEIIDNRYPETINLMNEAKSKMTTLEDYIRSNTNPDTTYVEKLTTEISLKTNEALQFELQKQNFKNELLDIVGEVCRLGGERMARSYNREVDSLPEILESSIPFRA